MHYLSIYIKKNEKLMRGYHSNKKYIYIPEVKTKKELEYQKLKDQTIRNQLNKGILFNF